MKKCECGNKITGSYRDHCEDCYAFAQLFWTDEPEVNPCSLDLDATQTARLEAVAA